jgi:hypothetical protein
MAAGVARATGASLAVEPGFTHSETDVVDQSGKTTHERLDALTQSYRLSLDTSFTDRLTAAAGGTFVDEQAWTVTDGVSSQSHGRTTSAFGRLSLATTTVTAGLGADRREQRFLSVGGTSFITENYTAYSLWRPPDLPEIDLRVNRANTYDATRRAQDSTTDSAVLAARYEAGSAGVRYLLSFSRTDDHLSLTESTAVDQTVLGTWSDSLFDRRTTAYASGSFTNRNATVTTHGDRGTVARQQAPVGGLSGIEALPATAENITLTANPLVIDGNTTATAGVDVGSGPAALGDRNARAVGGRFADVITPVNTFYVWFDKALTPEVGTALAASVAVYQSDDGQRWTRVTVSGLPVVSPFANRIEVTTPQQQARFLKVSLVPLAPGVTTDASFRTLFVTELQFLLVLPAALLPKTQTTFAGAANASVRTVIAQDPDLAHDIQASVARQSTGSVTTYSVVNGLSFGHKLTATIAANARGARQDQDVGRGHEGIWLWTASLAGNPLTTAFWSLTYSGTANDRDSSIAHSGTALARADLYDGISAQANAGASTFSQGDRSAQAGQASFTVSLTPNRWVTLSSGVLYSRSVASSPELGDVLTEFGRLDASVSLSPAPALSAAATVSRVFLAERPTTLSTLQLNYSPLRGDLQLAFAYSKTLDTTADATTESYGPSLRWNIRRGVSLTSAYTLLNDEAPAQLQHSRVVSVNLLVSL